MKAKRLIALLLSILLVLGMLPVSAMKPPDKFNIWVSGTQITVANKDDVLGDGGSVRFEPDTESTMSTLTLTNAHIAGAEVYESPPGGNYGIYCHDVSFNLVLVGDSTVAGKDAAGVSAGIYNNNGYILVSGDGTLTACGGTSKSSGGVYSTNLAIFSGTVNAYGGKGSNESAGIAGSTLNMVGGALTAAGGEATDSLGVSCSSISVQGGTIEAMGQMMALDVKPDFKNTDSTVEVNDDASAAGAAEWDENKLTAALCQDPLVQDFTRVRDVAAEIMRYNARFVGKAQ